MNNNYFKARFLILLDILLAFFSYAVTYALFLSLFRFHNYISPSVPMIIITAVIYIIVQFLFGLHKTLWQYSGSIDHLKLLVACIISAIISCVTGFFYTRFEFINFNFGSFNIVSNLIYCIMIGSTRFAIRLASKIGRIGTNVKGKRILVYGAGSLAEFLLRDITYNSNLHYNVIGLIDDNPKKKGLRMYNKEVLGDRYDLARICADENIEEIIFAIDKISADQKHEILDFCSNVGVKIKIMPGFETTLNTNSAHTAIREISIDDLLERDPITLDNKLIENDIHDKVVLVTGGGGSIGSELCRQIIKFKPEKLVIVDIYENTTYELENELRDEYPDQQLEVLIASVRDKERLEAIFDKYRPYMVFHAAAHKHVPLMEFSPQEAIKNNVFGTYNTAMCADKYGVKRFTLISTDKAVNPTNVMGATKRMCEMIVQTIQKGSKTEFVAVRFGNVLGSHGSVIPRFKKQIEKGGPVTVTHPDITRFFMTIPEAAQLVLQAAAYARGGEIFVLDMGKPVRIYDLAKKLISLYGYKPNIDIKIEFCGLREGEKLYEELLMNEEGLLNTSNDRIFVGQPIDISQEELEDKLNKLKNAIDKDEDTIKFIISQVIPTYQYKGKMKKNENSTEKEVASV